VVRGANVHLLAKRFRPIPERLLTDAAQYKWETKTDVAHQTRVKTAIIFFEDEMSLATQSTLYSTWLQADRTQGRKRLDDIREPNPLVWYK
jgi:hypothetical protein